MKNLESQNTGTLTLSNGKTIDYVLLPLTFENYKTKGAMFVEFWKEQNNSYLTGIGADHCPPVNSEFMFSKSIER